MGIEIVNKDKTANKILFTVSHRVYARAVENIEKGDHRVTGDLIRDSDVIKVNDYKYLVSFWADYARALEYGTSPHDVPFVALAEWAQAKFGASDEKTMGIAAAVKAKIAREGTSPRRFMDRAIHDEVYS